MKRHVPSLVAATTILFGSQAYAAKCVVGEYGSLSRALDGQVAQVSQGLLASQAVSYTTSTQSSPFGTSTRFIRVVCDAKAHFAIGASPSATANDQWVAPDAPEYFGVQPGQRIAFYDGVS